MTGKNITLMADFSGATATIMTAEGENEARVYRFTVATTIMVMQTLRRKTISSPAIP